MYENNGKRILRHNSRPMIYKSPYYTMNQSIHEI